MADQNIDFELVRKFIDGDESSFNKIVNKYKDKIYWHARRMTGNHLDADEIVQEVLFVIYKNLKGFKFKSSLYTWIYKITSTRSLNFLKRRKLKEIISLEDQAEKLQESTDDILENLEVKERLEAVNKVLKKLPAKQREIFILRNYENLSYKEISEITGKSIGALKSNYFHSIQKIIEMTREK
ncbi:MAG: RNA polymerase sigma factor [Ignavibacteriaceae bacterium]